MQMVMHLNTKRRWAVTSTPIKDGYVDTFALMYFLGYEPFSNGKYWNRFIQSPIKQGLDSGHERFEVLMKAISLRRTKDNELLGVPPKTIETLYVELNGEERKMYNWIKGEVMLLIRKDTKRVKFPVALSTILHLCQVCADVALCPVISQTHSV